MILEINNIDLVGRVFNGFDLHLKLIEQGINAKQLVLEKQSDVKSVIRLEHDFIQREEIRFLEKKYCVNNLLYPYADNLLLSKEFQDAEVVHFHFPYHQMFSLMDYPKIMDDRAVWTVHDPWITTGNCTHALGCDQWKKECVECNHLNDDYYPLQKDNVAFLWKIKRKYLQKINPHIIVASEYMRDLIIQSPLTKHFDKINIIPFGIDIKKYNKQKQCCDKVRIGFRADDAYLKGCHILYDALRNIRDKDDIILNSLGYGKIPKDIKAMYQVNEYGWLNSQDAVIDVLNDCDIFIIPSLAETFCLMAIEAMASGCAVICFDNTVVAEITDAPRCGLEVQYQSTAALVEAIRYLLHNKDEVFYRGRFGQKRVEKCFTFDAYVRRHIELYDSISKD